MMSVKKISQRYRQFGQLSPLVKFYQKSKALISERLLCIALSIITFYGNVLNYSKYFAIFLQKYEKFSSKPPQSP